MAALISIAACAMIGMSPVFVAIPSTAATRDASAEARQTAQTAHATSPDIERWRPYIAQASQRFGVPQTWIAAVMQAESRGRTHLHGRPITSRAGAMGLMQVMPATWHDVRQQHRLGVDPHDPHDNIMAGTAYLKAMYDRFGYPGLFAAYNAGPARYADHLRTGKPLPDETRAYMAALANTPSSRDMPPAILSGMRLFFTLGQDANTSPEASTNTLPTPAKSPSGEARTGPEDPENSPASGGLFVPRTPVSGGHR